MSALTTYFDAVPTPDRGFDIAEAIARARSAVIEAELEPTPASRYLAAHVAAQRVAALVLASHPIPRRRRPVGPSDPWQLVARAAPEYAEWAGYFAATQPKRQVVAAGVRAVVSEREADDMVRDADTFLAQVAAQLRRREQAVARGGGNDG